MKLNPKKCSFGMEEGKFLGYIVTSKGIRANSKKTKVVIDMPSPKTLKQMQSLSEKLAALNCFLSKSAERSLPFLDILKKCTNKKDFKWTEATEAAFLDMKKLVSELPTLTTPKKGDTLMMYLAAADEAVSVFTLPGVLGWYFEVYADSTGHHRWPDIASTEALLRVDLSNAMENLTPGPRAWRLYTDGASNNGGSRAGLILIALDDVEYSYALPTEMQVKDIHAFVDSKLVASQVEGSYEAKGERMIKYQEKVLELAGAFNRFRITDIPRAENRKADALSKLAARSAWVLRRGQTWDLDDFDRKLPKERNATRRPCQLREVHMGSYGMHDGPRQVVAKAINPGYYWPSMHIDAKELIRACDDCQAHASMPRLPKADMISVTLAWTFMKWGMDIVGPLPEGPGRVWDPSYNHHRQRNSGNGAVERANRSLLRGIKTRLEKRGPAWAEEVPNVLWAHRTMKKTRNGETPFSLTYGTEAVIPVEIGMLTHRTSNLNEKTNDQELRLNLYLVEERREIAAIREARRMRFPPHFVRLLMAFISTVTFSFNINGKVQGHVTPARGLRQGDPLSPYLFILCAEVLSRLIRKGLEMRIAFLLRAISPTKKMPTYKKTENIDKIIVEASGQVVNYDKSEISFSPNVTHDTRTRVLNILGVREGTHQNKYLGLPTIVGRSKKVIFQAIRDKITKKGYRMEREDVVHRWHLGLFNKALLAKQGWRLIKYPNSLMARVLKARYFPSSSFLDAKVRYRPSFVWRSICSAIRLINQGFAWNIGNGQSVDIWNDKWLSGISLLELRPSECVFQKVRDLMVDDGSAWDVVKVHTLFPIEIVRRILSTPIASHRSDTLFWEGTPHGATRLLQEFQDAAMRGNAQKGTNVNLLASIWQPPSYGFVKVNCDAAWLPSSKQAGIGFVARNSEGEVILWAVKTAHEKHLTKIEVETDSFVLYQSLSIGKPLLQISSMWHDIRELASTFECCHWTFVKRSGNVVAHSIARWALGDNVYSVVDGLVHLESSFCALVDDS
ncbi:reverse transcriptase domain-containing protein [Tanacetum coccineum]